MEASLSGNPLIAKLAETMCARPATAAPVSAAAVRADAGIVLARAEALLGYETFLGEARAWRARTRKVPPGYDRSLALQAKRAVRDTQSLAAATVRLTDQFKQAGQLDSIVDGWAAGLEASGPVALADLLAHVRGDATLAPTLRERGISAPVWDHLLDNLGKVGGTLSAKDGKLVAELADAGGRPRTFVVGGTDRSRARTLSALRARGRFARHAAHFERLRGDKMHLRSAPGDEREIADVILAGAVLSTQSIAQHQRELEDIGLAKYNGQGPIVIVVVAALAATALGYLLYREFCEESGHAGDHSNKALCFVGKLLTVLGTLVLLWLLLGLIGWLAGVGEDGSFTCSGPIYVVPGTDMMGCEADPYHDPYPD